jgi:IclR family transcriptional regulator, KDG regulon repressor
MKPATTVEKVCRVLSVLRGKPALGVTEVAAEAKLLPSDAHRILNSLRAFGYVDQNINTKKYHLGLELLKLGHSVYRHLDVGEVAKPKMRRLSEMATAVSNLAILDARGVEVLFVEQIDSPSDFQVRLRIGSRASPYATAVGKMLTAHQDPSTVLRILRKCGMRKNTKLRTPKNSMRSSRKSARWAMQLTPKSPSRVLTVSAPRCTATKGK